MQHKLLYTIYKILVKVYNVSANSSLSHFKNIYLPYWTSTNS